VHTKSRILNSCGPVAHLEERPPFKRKGGSSILPRPTWLTQPTRFWRNSAGKSACLLSRKSQVRFLPPEPSSGCSAVRLAHLHWEQEVAGSSPATPTTKLRIADSCTLERGIKESI
jgi:hypothetical protein